MKESAFFSAGLLFHSLCSLCVPSTLHKYKVCSRCLETSEWKDGFEQGPLCLLLPLASSLSVWLFVHFFIHLFIHSTFIASGLVGGPVVRDGMKRSFQWVEAKHHGQISPSSSVHFILYFGKLISKLLSAPIPSSPKLLSSTCFVGRKWHPLWQRE